MNCRPSCVQECPPVTEGTRCADYRKQLQRRAAQLGQEAGVDVPFRLQKLGVPADAILALRKLQPTRSLDAARRFLSAQRDIARTLLLAGTRGVGKTVAAAYVLADHVRKHDWNGGVSGGKQLAPFVWASAAEVTAETDFGRVSPEWLEGLRHARLLVLDDLGEDGTVVGMAALADLLKLRHEKRRATVITSNLPVDPPKDKPGASCLRKRYGDSWFARLAVAAIAPALINEPSLRRRP